MARVPRVSAAAIEGRFGETSPKLAIDTASSEGGSRYLGAKKLVLVAMMLTGASSMAAQQQLPSGAGVEVIKARCVSCHETDLITSQRLAPAGWSREIDKMVRWGAVVSVEQREQLQTYLVRNYGPRPSAAHVVDTAAAASGEATFKRACLGCHGMDLVEQQRLSRAGWVREVEKMMRWGATVNPSDKDALVDHLATHFGVR